MAVTAYPVILINTTDAGSSDTAASGAGPATALTGSAATTDGAGTTVTLDGSPDLTNVATDGSHVIYLRDTNANARRFAAINGKGASTVDVEQAFAASLPGTAWAIGGIRDSLAGSDSSMLYDRDGADGDAEPGWTIELGDGHVEAVNSPDWLAAGTNELPLVLRGESGAASRPRLTSNVNSAVGVINSTGADNFQYRDFDLETDQPTAYGLRIGGGNVVGGMRILNTNASPTSGFGIQQVGRQVTIADTLIDNFGSNGLAASSQYGLLIYGCTFSRNEAGFNANAGMVIKNNLFINNRSHGIDIRNQIQDFVMVVVDANTCYGNGGDGIRCSGINNQANMAITNNICQNNGAYGIHLTNAAMTTEAVRQLWIYANNTFNNTSGNMKLGGEASAGNFGELSVNLDAQFADAPGGDFNVGTNMQAIGWPRVMPS